MDDVFLATVIVVILIIVGWVIIAAMNAEHKKKVKEKLESLPDFTPTDSYVSRNARVSVAYDAERREVCFINSGLEAHIYPYGEILKSEVSVDGQTILSQSTSNTVGRAVLGGIVAGGVGAVIGGLSGSKKQKDKINSIDLKVFVNDPPNPVYKVNFLDEPQGVNKGGFAYNAHYEIAERWHGIITALMRQADDLKKKEEKQSRPIESAPASSVADELLKLKSLLDAGALTEEEFAEQKRRLLEKGE